MFRSTEDDLLGFKIRDWKCLEWPNKTQFTPIKRNTEDWESSEQKTLLIFLWLEKQKNNSLLEEWQNIKWIKRFG